MSGHRRRDGGKNAVAFWPPSRPAKDERHGNYAERVPSSAREDEPPITCGCRVTRRSQAVRRTTFRANTARRTEFETGEVDEQVTQPSAAKERTTALVAKAATWLEIAVASMLASASPRARPSRAPLRRLDRRPDLEGVWSYAWITTRSGGFAGLELTTPKPAHSKPSTPACRNRRCKAAPSARRPASGGRWAQAGPDRRARPLFLDRRSGGRQDALLRRRAGSAPRAPDAGSITTAPRRPPPERRLMGAGGTSLPPMLNAGYNALLQINVDPGPCGAADRDERGSAHRRPGDGRHEPGGFERRYRPDAGTGDTLVIETTGHPQAAFGGPSRLFVSPTGRVTERFTKVGPTRSATPTPSTTPATFTQVWRGRDAVAPQHPAHVRIPARR